MRGCHEKRTPQRFTAWLALENPDWKPSYPDLQGDIRRSVVEALSDAQRGLCVYCGRRLHPDRPGRFHIEHFRPQSTCPDLAIDLANLFLSCGPETETGKPSETCGHAKANWFDKANCIEPDYPDCTQRFRFLLNGKVAAARTGDASAESMIDILNLDHRELRKERKDIFDIIEFENLKASDFFDAETGMAEGYAHVACAYLGAVIP